MISKRMQTLDQILALMKKTRKLTAWVNRSSQKEWQICVSANSVAIGSFGKSISGRAKMDYAIVSPLNSISACNL